MKGTKTGVKISLSVSPIKMFTFSCPSRSEGDTQTGNKNALIQILYLTPLYRDDESSPSS